MGSRPCCADDMFSFSVSSCHLVIKYDWFR